MAKTREYQKEIRELLSEQSKECIKGISMLTRSTFFREAENAARAMREDGASILITGETGTGKELLARRIAQNAGKDLLVVNSAAINPALAESEFFGHVKGAFTGATENRVGYFESAKKGILFLDEVAELPPYLQAKLLRAIEQREFTKVGKSDPQKHAASLIAATNTPEKLRPDFRWRFPVQIELSPLRDRRIDIFFILHGWLKEKTNGEADWRIDWKSLTALMLGALEGNVRELVNAAQTSLSEATDRRGFLEFQYRPPVGSPLSSGRFCLQVWQEIARNIRHNSRGKKILPVEFGTKGLVETMYTEHVGESLYLYSWSTEALLNMFADLSHNLPSHRIPDAWPLEMRLDLLGTFFGGSLLSERTRQAISKPDKESSLNLVSMSEKECQDRALTTYYAAMHARYGNSPTTIAKVAGVSPDTVARRLRELDIH